MPFLNLQKSLPNFSFAHPSLLTRNIRFRCGRSWRKSEPFFSTQLFLLRPFSQLLSPALSLYDSSALQLYNNRYIAFVPIDRRKFLHTSGIWLCDVLFVTADKIQRWRAGRLNVRTVQDGEHGPRNVGQPPQAAVRIGATQAERQERIRDLRETRTRRRRRCRAPDGPAMRNRRHPIILQSTSRVGNDLGAHRPPAYGCTCAISHRN